MQIRTEDLDFAVFDAVKCDLLVCNTIGVLSESGKPAAMLGVDKKGNGILTVMDTNGDSRFIVTFDEEKGNPRCSILGQNKEEMASITTGDEFGGAVIIHKDNKAQKVLSAKGVQDADEIRSESTS